MRRREGRSGGLQVLCVGPRRAFHDHKYKLPLSAHVLHAWSRLAQQAKGMPLPREWVGAIAL